MIYTQTYYAPGKVLLAGEYTALIGLECFALPVKQGHVLQVWKMSDEGNTVFWSSYSHLQQKWFECEINTQDFLEKSTDNATVSGRLCELLQGAKMQNEQFLGTGTYRVESALQFNQVYGLGSSSSLVAIIAQWANVDFKPLQKQVFGGSGYDAAVCYVQKPLVYWLGANEQANWSTWKLDEHLAQQWHLVFIGKKVNSRFAVENLKQNLENIANEPMMLKQLDKLLQQIKNAKTIAEMELSLEVWQGFLAQALGLPNAYTDFNITPIKGGLCKYLGAWGGDIVLVNETILNHYPHVFEQYHKVKWDDFVVNE